MDPIWQEINQAIHRRDTKTVHRLIPKYLRSKCSSAEAVYEASEFYRKITDYKNALRVLPKERMKASGPDRSDAETKLELQLARLLNSLGASNYALRMIDRIQAEGRVRSKVEIGEIYFCNYKWTEIVKLLGEKYPLPKVEPWHQDWLLHFYISYALSELKQTDLAIERVQKMREISASPLIQAMTLSYEGKYLLTAGEPKKALASLLESQKYFQENDQTADHGYFQTFLGECYIALGEFKKAQKALKQAFKIFYQPSLKPEDWIEALFLLEQIPNNRKSDKRLVPRLRAMASPGYLPFARVKADNLENESDAENRIFSISKIERSRKKKHLDRKSDVSWIGKKARLGLDLVDNLICNLVYAGEYGLPQFRVYEILWPDEPFSFNQHQKRLEWAVGTARKRGYKILWKDLHLYLTSDDVSVSSPPKEVIRGNSFLAQHPTFSRQDVENYFSVAVTAAKILIRDWINSGRVISEKTSQYQVVALR